ncbi:MAG: Hsp70 family protein [Planctomycetales bacterium]
MPDHPPVGIDLGTTFSAVAHLDSDGRPWTILNSDGDLTTPSVVYFDTSGAVVGKEAVAAGEFEPARLAQFAKRDIGEAAFSKEIRGQRLPAEVLQAVILKRLKNDAELKLGAIKKVVITVPAFFNEPCRKATQDAGRLAGLEVLDIINEPTAAAICFGIQQGFLSDDGTSRGQEKILIYDLGGGTFDVTLMDIDGKKFTALATAGDVYLGGVDWDDRLVIHLAEAFQVEHGVDLFGDPIARQMLMQKAAETKHSLSTRESVTVFVSYEGRRLKHEVTRATFEELTADLLDRTLMTVNKLLREAKVEFKDLTRLLLVGGSTRMPAVTEMLERETGLQADRSLSPDESVAHGAAIYAGLLMKTGAERINGMSVTNVSSHELGILGVERETGRKRRSTMIPRNTQLPVKARKTFPTLRDNQRSVEVNVIEGGDSSGNNSTAIGKCQVKGLPENLPAKTPVQVTFKYGSDGRLTVQASLPTIGKDAEMTIQRAAGLSEEAIAKWLELVESGLPDSSVETPAAESAPAASDTQTKTTPKPSPVAEPQPSEQVVTPVESEKAPPVIEEPPIQPAAVQEPAIQTPVIQEPAAETPAIESPVAEELAEADELADEGQVDDEDDFDESELADEEYEDELMADESSDEESAGGDATPQFFMPADDDEDELDEAEEEFNFPQIDVAAPTVTEPAAPPADEAADPSADPPEETPKKKLFGGWRSRAKKLSE